MKNLYKIQDELYVVRNNVGVSENCWIITNGELVQVSYLLSDEVAKGFKVILTTNKLLIKDGVQAIDDEFLEWFVKNPSCESVETERLEDGQYVDRFADGSVIEGIYENYKIIIPKEEPKQDFVYKCTCLRPQVNCFSGMCSYCNRQIVKNLTTEDLKQKQETLEEVAKKYVNGRCTGGIMERALLSAIEFGAKWQQERSYSEEDMKIAFDANIKDWISFEEFIEQFKNK